MYVAAVASTMGLQLAGSNGTIHCIRGHYDENYARNIWGLSFALFSVNIFITGSSEKALNCAPISELGRTSSCSSPTPIDPTNHMALSGQHYGETLPDQVDRISASFSARIQLVADSKRRQVRELYKDRVALERDYATKLQALAKRAADKKSKLESAVVLGDDPTKAWDESVLKQNTLNTAYESIIASMVNSAQDHNNIADTLTTQVIEALKTIERKHENIQRTEEQFYQKLISDRDRTYSERVKVSKQKYDEECGEVESSRQKHIRAGDDKHADRIARQAEQQRFDMLNSKNTYIISIATANKTKNKFYNTDMVHMENQLQTIQTRLVNKFTKVLLHAQALQMSHLDVLKNRLAETEAILNEVDPSKDDDLYIEYNIRPFTAPADWKFEPCHNFYDTEDMSIEPDPKTVLQNRLRRSRGKLQELAAVIENKQREYDQLEKLALAYDSDHSLGNVEDISDQYLETDHNLTFFRTSECILNAEIDTIVNVIGDDVGAQTPHNFKSSSFSIPTTCGYCKTSIWGLSKQGKTCKACNLSVHAKCELKVPADCQRGASGNRHSSRLSTSTNLSRINSTSMPPHMETPTASSFVHSVPESESSYLKAKVLFDFTATSEFELTVTEGTVVQVIENDDGSGWLKVRDGRDDGLVPASYLEYGAEESHEQGSGQYVKALYAYQAQGPDELGLKEGELIELSSGSSGGQYYGEGWWEGISSKGQKGIFPSNYVESL
ncbi:hypothetical protein GYMLUDRAFT_247116 [Collybiopsis luxurians FD-317 M1]|uniref:Protein BZZ1 n=1 Tax=Collybiopsis luxurians FD-317 M1 TaxID=944289 RepID=A0A0D0CPC6_9AGAR|nr:hypothetical protein GYMLUDRAFT_247116 [Collybiopsis luxurians FD-317 M1]